MTISLHNTLNRSQLQDHERRRSLAKIAGDRKGELSIVVPGEPMNRAQRREIAKALKLNRKEKQQ